MKKSMTVESTDLSPILETASLKQTNLNDIKNKRRASALNSISVNSGIVLGQARRQLHESQSYIDGMEPD